MKDLKVISEIMTNSFVTQDARSTLVWNFIFGHLQKNPYIFMSISETNLPLIDRVLMLDILCLEMS